MKLTGKPRSEIISSWEYGGSAAAIATPEPEAAAPETEELGDRAGGNDPNSVCSNNSCGHPASQHEATEDGRYAGGCLADGCNCSAFTTNEEPTEGKSNDDGESDSASEEAPAKGAHAEGTESLAAEGPEEVEEPEQVTKTQPPEVEGGEAMGPQFTIPVAVIEGEPTGDGRAIAPEALGWRTPPLPLLGMATQTHDPTGMSSNFPAVICGRIDTIERVPGPETGTTVLLCRGYFLNDDNGQYFAEIAEQMGRIGVSADIAVEDSEQEITDIDTMGFPTAMEETLTKGVLTAVTIVPTPAFEGAYLVLGDGGEQPEAIPQSTEDEVAQTAAGRIHWMTLDTECEPCKEGLDVLEASGGPIAPPAAWFANPEFTEGDGRLMEILDRRSQRVVGGKYACPLTITDDGRVFGHIAPWGICHTGIKGTCVTAPRTRTGYAHFKRGQHVITAEGERQQVGVITMDAGHAPTRGISATAAMAHYDNTALSVADVNAGEDEYGIWVAGAIRPDVTEDQVRKLRAASISGDWRNLGGGLELVAALAVNQPGYPLAVVAAGHQEAVVASGAGVMHALKDPTYTNDEGDALVRALAPLLEDARGRAAGKLLARKRNQALERIRNRRERVA